LRWRRCAKGLAASRPTCSTTAVLTAAPCPAAILVLDDKDMVRRGVVRLLKIAFRTVLDAKTPQVADRILASERPAFLLCDYWLGRRYPPATTFIPHWRATCPWLLRVALMTGTSPEALGRCDGVDRIFQKPLDHEALYDFFLSAPADP